MRKSAYLLGEEQHLAQPGWRKPYKRGTWRVVAPKALISVVGGGQNRQIVAEWLLVQDGGPEKFRL